LPAEIGRLRLVEKVPWTDPRRVIDDVHEESRIYLARWVTIR
ncbi:unnamed protein product, partial [Haemonchus placei]|uniref:Transposase n=1 Tax=Haemonchus placei TaxID=6290 RepID=A0A0N4X7X4_HAEPC